MDAFAAVLAIPPALTAALELIRRYKGSTSPITEHDFSDLEERIQTVTGSMFAFCTVTDDLKPWKYAHHCTNVILHSEMAILFRLNRPGVNRLFSHEFSKLENELDKQNDLNSSLAFLQSKSTDELEVKLPDLITDIIGTTPWYQFAIQCNQGLHQLADNRDPDEFFKMLDAYRNFARALNFAADAKLLAGLQRISDKLDEVRAQLPN